MPMVLGDRWPLTTRVVVGVVQLVGTESWESAFPETSRCCKRLREGGSEQKDEDDGGRAISQLIRYLVVLRLARGCRVSARHVGFGLQYLMHLRVHPRRPLLPQVISVSTPTVLWAPSTVVASSCQQPNALAVVHIRLTTFDASVVFPSIWPRIASNSLHRPLYGGALELGQQHSRPDTYRSTLHDTPCSYPL